MSLSKYAVEAIKRDRRRPDRSSNVHSTRVQRIVQQESLTAVLYKNRKDWVQSVAEAGFTVESSGGVDVAYATVGTNKVYYGYYSIQDSAGYLDARASYPKSETMIAAIKECTAMNTRTLRKETALTSYFKKSGMNVEVEGDEVTVWTNDMTVYADAVEIAAELGAQVGPVKDVEDGARMGISFKLLQSAYPNTGLDHEVPENDNHPKPVKPGVNIESRRGAKREAQGHSPQDYDDVRRAIELRKKASKSQDSDDIEAYQVAMDALRKAGDAMRNKQESARDDATIMERMIDELLADYDSPLEFQTGWYRSEYLNVYAVDEFGNQLSLSNMDEYNADCDSNVDLENELNGLMVAMDKIGIRSELDGDSMTIVPLQLTKKSRKSESEIEESGWYVVDSEGPVHGPFDSRSEAEEGKDELRVQYGSIDVNGSYAPTEAPRMESRRRRLRESRQFPELGDRGAGHAYEVEVKDKDGIIGSVKVHAKNRNSAASYATKAGYEVRSVNMVG
jgi:hypothetical protein